LFEAFHLTYDKGNNHNFCSDVSFCCIYNVVCRAKFVSIGKFNL